MRNLRAFSLFIKEQNIKMRVFVHFFNLKKKIGKLGELKELNSKKFNYLNSTILNSTTLIQLF